MLELRRSLGTTDYSIARRRAVDATIWFRRIVIWLESMISPDREELEKAANAYFLELVKDVDRPRNFPDDNFDDELAFQIEESEKFVRRQDMMLTSQDYDEQCRVAGRNLIEQLGLDFGDLEPSAQYAAIGYAVRAERQRMQYYLHSLRSPASVFVADDGIFRNSDASDGTRTPTSASSTKLKILRPEITLERGVGMYIDYKVAQGWQGSMRDESLRVLGWLQEEIDPSAPLSTIGKDAVRDFRDCLLRLAGGAQGRKRPLRQRLSEDGQNILTFATRERYWRFTRSFFAWFQSEFSIPDPTDGLLFAGGRDELQQSPDPFSTDELRRFLATPLFSGYKSIHRRAQPGTCLKRSGHWWAGVLMLHTGIRAGDCAQLLPTDFMLDDPVPHLAIRPGPLPEGGAKRSKFGPRTHLVPLVPDLFVLGLREFVEGRAKKKPKVRLLYEISLGGNRMSNGLTKFWKPYLERFGLYSWHRATHVFRHTVASHLRSAGVMNEDIGAVLGHSWTNQTAQYGGVQDLPRKLRTLEHLDFGFDVVAALGGAYDPKKH